jgi:hypothetical protein
MVLTISRALAVALSTLCAIGLLLGSAGAEVVVKKPVLRPASAPAASAATAKEGPAPVDSANPVAQFSHGRVYILRGWLNVFSRGMDSLSVKLQSQGVPSVIANHRSWQGLADQLIETYPNDKNAEPIIIIGHSLGAGAALVMANYVGLKGVPVRLVISFDPVGGVEPVLGTVGEVINYYKPRSSGQPIKGTKHFHGTLENIDLSTRANIDHLNIDKIEVLHEEVIAKVLTVLKEKRKVAAKAK